MWNPKRIFLAMLGLLIFTSSYFIYSRILGGYDGLPVLPERYRKGQGSDVVIPISPSGISPYDGLLTKAFGPNCVELAYDFKFYMRDKRVLMATRETPSVINEGPKQGWLKMTPVSVAVFGKSKGPDGLDEISTLYADIAYIQFDKPIRTLNELDGRKVVSAEMHSDAEALTKDRRRGRIHIINNRKTSDHSDDIELVTIGPIFYVDTPKPGEANIFTNELVQMTDYSNAQFPPPVNRPVSTVGDAHDPREATAVGLGMRIYLAESESKSKDKKPAKIEAKGKSRKDEVGGVERIELLSNVVFSLWTDPSQSMLATGKSPSRETKLPEPREINGKSEVKAKLPVEEKKLEAGKNDLKNPKAAPVVEKKLMVIKTNGRFEFDMIKNIAHFEKPKNPKPGLVEDVTVTRAGRLVGNDQLVCEYLDILFQRREANPNKAAGAPAPKKDDDGDMEIKELRAWGENIAITSDSENLHAYGSELIHIAAEKKTILRGHPQKKMYAIKDANLIRGIEMTMFGSDDGMNSAIVQGPGMVGMGEVDPKSNEYPKQATWGDKLLYSKIQDKGRQLDLMTFTGKADIGKARFFDKGEAPGQEQDIEANQIKVWLLPAEEGKKDAKKTEPKKNDKKEDPTTSAKPTRVEATGEVKSHSMDMEIKRCDYLNVHFKDVNKLMKEPEPKKKELAKVAPAPVEPGKIDPFEVDPKLPKAPPKPPEAKKETRDPPMTIVAKTMETWVNRDPEGKLEMDRLHAEGDVEVHQDPTPDNERGTHVLGRTMDVKAYPEGNLMVVLGEENIKKYGLVQFDKITIYGFDITIDQRVHTTTVKGEGSMDMLTNTDMEGKKLDKPTNVTVWWFHKMEFFGADKQCHYHGRVQALQEDKKPDQTVVTKQMKGEWMQVLFDRPIFLNPTAREKDKSGKQKDSPNIDVVLVFHEPKDDAAPRPREPRPVVSVEKTVESGKLMKLQTIQTPELSIENKAGANAVGGSRFIGTSSENMPGVVRIWAPGKIDEDPSNKNTPPAKTPPKAAPLRKPGELAADEEMKLTVVQYAGKMVGEDKRKQVKFYKDVKVVHVPTNDPNLPVEIRQATIPEGAFYIEARDMLEVTTVTRLQKDAAGKDMEVSYNDMKATTAVKFRKQGEFHGEADMMTYSEEKGIIIFYGRKDNPAVVNQIQGQGVRDKTLKGERIRYDTRTKNFEVDKASSLSQ